MVSSNSRARLLQYVVIAATLFYIGGAVFRSSDESAFWDLWVTYAVELLAAGLCLLRSVRVKDAERLPWGLLSAAMLVWIFSDIYWTISFSNTDEPPSLSLADVGYLGFYPLTYAGVILLIRSRMHRTPRSVWLDGLVGGLASASVCAAVFFQPIAAQATDAEIGYVIVNLAYPCADLLLVTLVVCSFALSGWRPDRSWVLLGVALVMLAMSDTGYLFSTARDWYTQGGLIDVGWVLAMVLLGMSAWRRPKRVDAMVFESWIIVTVPFGFALVALAVLTGNRLWNAPSTAMLLALGAIGVGFVRMALTFSEVRSLSESRREARTDELTSLGNRRAFYERLDGLLRNRKDQQHLALLLIDLDRFKEVNDSLGHQFGDRLLRQIGPRLKSLTREEDMVVRLGGDEFAIIIEAADVPRAVAGARRVREILDTPFILDGVPVKIGASIGIAAFPQHGTDANTLLRHADVAMYGAKQERSQHRVYEPALDQHTRDRLNTINELRDALDEDRLIVHYQPKIYADGSFAGAEALVRMRNPKGDLVPPDLFLPLAEQAGLMHLLTARVLDLVLADITRWRDDGRHVKVAVNLSVTNLLDADFPDHVASALRRYQLPGRCLVFEITETTVLTDPDRALEAVKRLRALGSDTSLDDYGTGYASIAYLRQMPLDELKLDRSFVSNLESEEIARSFFTTTVTLAHVLGLRVVAEGIETESMWAAARAAGCDVGQGYLFSRPVPFEGFVPAVNKMLALVNARPRPEARSESC